MASSARGRRMRTQDAALGTAVFLAAAPGVVAGAVPWLLTGWRTGASLWAPLRWLGGAVVAVGASVLVAAFVRFVVEGRGTPAPIAPTEELVVGGLYRHVRNPMYVAVVAVILGQALPLGWGGWGLRPSAGTGNRHWPDSSAPATRITAPPCRHGGPACAPGGRSPSCDRVVVDPYTPEAMTLRLANVTFDCDDVLKVAEFWSAALGRSLDPDASEFFASIGLTDDDSPNWFFAKVPEAKVAKNRVHVDLAADDREAEIARLVDLGATRGQDHDEWGHSWTVMADPEGNEFCVS